MPDVIRIGRAMGSSGMTLRHDLEDFAPGQLVPQVVPLGRDGPGWLSATQPGMRL
jgi:hypothetical protein